MRNRVEPVRRGNDSAARAGAAGGRAAVKAVQGEDWREPFRNGPDDYQRYLEARKKRAAKPPAIAISVSGGN